MKRGLEDLVSENVIQRIWNHDYTVWKQDPTEIVNRLGWLHSVEEMQKRSREIIDWVDSVRSDGYTEALLLGMGGSSLAPEVFRNTLGIKEDFLNLTVIDTTDPDVIEEVTDRIVPEKTLFIVSTKSGSTVETLSLFKYFYNLIMDSVGMEDAGSHFIAVTDPGSSLEAVAERLGFRKIFLNDPNIGGRYSVFSFFGLVPAALIGTDISLLLDRASHAVSQSRSNDAVKNGSNEAALLGIILGEAAQASRDKLSFILSPSIQSFGHWLEQLIAESTGKAGKGILPVISEPLGPPHVYDNDRLFLYMKYGGDTIHDEAMHSLETSDQPLIRIVLTDGYDLGTQMFIWEMATVIAGYRLGINPFDQPNVEEAKIRAREMVAAYQLVGKLQEDVPASKDKDTLLQFLSQTRKGDYITIQAYMTPSDRLNAAFRIFRSRLQDKYHLATTLGYGPRFLHSTGQLHKGDNGGGLFIQLTADHEQDIPIPDQPGATESSMTFGTLQMAQALGDKQALMAKKRRVIRFHLSSDTVQEMKRLIEYVS